MKKKPKAPKHSAGSKRTPSSKANTISTENPSKWIRIDQPFGLPSYVKEALDRLDDAGHVAYVVGGSVRDFLLKRETKDHDIATSASPDELCQLFPQAVTVGKAFGVLKVPVEGVPYPLEMATFRQDLDYEDHRHPTGVLFSDPIQDAERRDFTINALFYDPKTSRILDTVGGMEDLRGKVVRAIGDPIKRFREDSLRLLRAVRFATQLDFKLDPATAEAIRVCCKLLTKVSAERIRDELNLIWTGPRPAQAIQMLSELKLLPLILPEFEALKGVTQNPQYHPEGDVWNHTLKIMETLTRLYPVRSVTLAWGTLLHDVGKPMASRRSGGKNFNGHESDGVKIAHALGGRFRLSRDEIGVISWLVAEHLKFKDVFHMRESTLKRFVRQPFFEELLALHHADCLSSDGNLAFYKFCLACWEEVKKTPPTELAKLITGADLIQLGLQPGPRFATILRTVEDLALENKLRTKQEALEYVIEHFKLA